MKKSQRPKLEDYPDTMHGVGCTEYVFALEKYCDSMEKLISIETKLEKLSTLPKKISKHTLSINRCAALIKIMPIDQAIQIMKSEITGHPPSTIIDGKLVVAYVR